MTLEEAGMTVVGFVVVNCGVVAVVCDVVVVVNLVVSAAVAVEGAADAAFVVVNRRATF